MGYGKAVFEGKVKALDMQIHRKIFLGLTKIEGIIAVLSLVLVENRLKIWRYRLLH
jgi:hypothetical protein